jgi:hypothetical protein
VGKPEGRRSLGKPRRRWENSIKTDLRVTRWGGVGWLRIGNSGGFL